MRAKRLAREVLVFWRRHDKEATETKKKAEKEEIEEEYRCLNLEKFTLFISS